MKRLMIVLIFISSVNANDLFDIQRLGQVIEVLYKDLESNKILNEKRFKVTSLKLELYEKEIETLKKEITSLRQSQNYATEHKLEKELEIVEDEYISRDVNITSKEPFESIFDVRVSKSGGTYSYLSKDREESNRANFYEYNTTIVIELCDIHQWCKLYSKEEYIPRYYLGKI